MSNHISSCKTRNKTDKIDRHAFDCRQKHPNSREPWFLVDAFLTVKDQSSRNKDSSDGLWDKISLRLEIGLGVGLGLGLGFGL